MVLTPRFFSAAAWALAVSISSLKSTDATPAGLTNVGVASRVIPMKPILTPLTARTATGGSNGLPLDFFTTLAASHVNDAPS
ncbi:MAG: hypothetical protein BWY91_02365 [bacterium ADurb.BinA028]|nr:MAG: hypothetical protein BWY91_02365 [bacterium ADurb.BinA028]